VPDKRIYVPAVQEGFEWVLPVDEADHEVFRGLDGTPRRDRWKPVRVYRLTESPTGAPLAESDLPWLASHVLVLREKAVAAFPALTDHGELLPLECPDADLWVFNALRLIDAVDENASTLVRFSSGRILNIERHVFHPDRVQDVEVFKLPQMPRGWLYVTDDFVSRAASAGLRGVGFEQVWEQEG